VPLFRTNIPLISCSYLGSPVLSLGRLRTIAAPDDAVGPAAVLLGAAGA